MLTSPTAAFKKRPAPLLHGLAANPLAEFGGLISELGNLWSKHADFGASLEAICGYGQKMLQADGACVLMQEGGEFRVVASSGLEPLPDLRVPSDAFRLGPGRTGAPDSGGAAASVLPGVFGSRCLLVRPIAQGERVRGFFVVFRKDGRRPFVATEEAQAAVLARQAAFTYSIERRTRVLELIYEVTRAINSSLQLEEVLECIQQGIRRILPTDNLYIALYDEAANEIRFEIEVEHRQRLPKRSRPRGAGLTEYLLETRRPLLLPRDFTANCKARDIRFSGRAARCWMGAPMVIRDKAVGVIALQSYDDEDLFDADDLSILENLAGQAAGSLENARLYQQACASSEQAQTAHQLLLQSEKLAAVGQLISGIAHELNNPLTAVVGWTQYLLSQPASEPIRRQLSTINVQSQRASKIVQNLLTFSRQHRPEQTLVQLRDIVESTLALRAYELRVNNIVVERNYGPPGSELPLVAADAHQVQQVILNLIINAEQAILSARHGGRITIATQECGDNVRLAVADDGPGILPELLEKIFDPFFTTKPIGQGTGLGLSISYGILQQHSGNIWAEYVPGAGARFIVELPVATRPRGARIALARSTVVPEASQRLLIVDDEESVRELLVAVLGDQPILIETAATGEEGVEKASRTEFDLIVTDLKMPGLSGAQLYRKLRETAASSRPHFIFMTGDVLSPETRQFLESTQSHCVLKPFDINEAREVILKALLRANDFART